MCIRDSCCKSSPRMSSRTILGCGLGVVFQQPARFGRIQRRPFGKGWVTRPPANVMQEIRVLGLSCHFRAKSERTQDLVRGMRAEHKQRAREIISSRFSDFVSAVLLETMTGGRRSRMGLQGLTAAWVTSGVPASILPVALQVALPSGG